MITLTPDDLLHIRRMTSKLQICVFLMLKKRSKGNKIELTQNTVPISRELNISEPLVKDILERLILDEHIQWENGFKIGIQSGRYYIGSPNNGE